MQEPDVQPAQSPPRRCKRLIISASRLLTLYSLWHELLCSCLGERLSALLALLDLDGHVRHSLQNCVWPAHKHIESQEYSHTAMHSLPLLGITYQDLYLPGASAQCRSSHTHCCPTHQAALCAMQPRCLLSRNIPSCPHRKKTGRDPPSFVSMCEALQFGRLISIALANVQVQL